MAEIESIELFEELPRSRKIIGTGLENLRKGIFDVDGYGRGRLYLNPQLPPLLLIRTQHSFVIVYMRENVLHLKGNDL